jgi:TDG/mug DNA glycosylase family protein
LKVLVVGFNPSPASHAAGHFYAHPGNRFWQLIHDAGWTEERLGPEEDFRLLERGIGFLDLSDRPTASSSGLRTEERRRGAQRVHAAVRALSPEFVACTGKGVAAALVPGRVPLAYGLLEPSPWCASRLFVLPSPSGRAGLRYEEKLRHYRLLARLAGWAML